MSNCPYCNYQFVTAHATARKIEKKDGELVNIKSMQEHTPQDQQLIIREIARRARNQKQAIAIGRELGCRRYEKWEDGRDDFILSSRMVALNEIELDGKKISMEQIEITPSYQIKIKADGITKVREVSYIEGVELHQFHRYKIDDFKLKNELASSNISFSIKLINSKLFNPLLFENGNDFPS